jgi:DUF1009 family protein
MEKLDDTVTIKADSITKSVPCIKTPPVVEIAIETARQVSPINVLQTIVSMVLANKDPSINGSLERLNQ